MQIDDSVAHTHGIHGHQQHFFNTFLTMYDVRGRDILEVGGAMPSSLVLDVLGVNSWTCIQSEEYTLHRSDNQIPSATQHTRSAYMPRYANIEDLGDTADFTKQFDAVFSIACFEHIHKLPQALQVMHQALRPEGKLFSLFAPIWSGPWGQHYTDTLPERFNSIAPPEGWASHSIFGPWDHLLMSRFQYFSHYREKFDTAFAEELTYITYNSPQINRYFFEDYVNFIDQTQFQKLVLKGVFTLPDAPQTQSDLATLRTHFAAQGYRNFSDAGILAFLCK